MFDVLNRIFLCNFFFNCILNLISIIALAPIYVLVIYIYLFGFRNVFGITKEFNFCV